MNPIFNTNVIKMEIYHKDYNLQNKDNLNNLPDSPAVFGIFGIIHDTPIHPRFVGATKNLRDEIKGLFEHAASNGLKKYMQGPWIKMLSFELCNGLSDEELKAKKDAWIREYEPMVDENGEYPKYNYEWPYNDDGTLKAEYAFPPTSKV